WSRQNHVPTLGVCLGLQVMAIEFARNVLGIEEADSTEVDPTTPEPVIATAAEIARISRGEAIDTVTSPLGEEAVEAGVAQQPGMMRLGSYAATLQEGTLAAATYGSTSIAERHRHRY